MQKEASRRTGLKGWGVHSRPAFSSRRWDSFSCFCLPVSAPLVSPAHTTFLRCRTAAPTTAYCSFKTTTLRPTGFYPTGDCLRAMYACGVNKTQYLTLFGDDVAVVKQARRVATQLLGRCRSRFCFAGLPNEARSGSRRACRK